MTRILGIDPGSRATGFGVIEHSGNKSVFVASGAIVTQGDDMIQRLGEIFRRMREVIDEYQPQEVAIERVFLARNPDSALKLGQARGVAIAAVLDTDMAVFEYSARQVKQAVVGRGGAEKRQVAHMVGCLLGVDAISAGDAADALAIAICHAHMRTGLARLSGVTSVRGGRLRT